LKENLQFHRDYFSTDPGRAEMLLKQGDSRNKPELDQKELAAYAAVASLMLNMDEVVTKQ